MAEPELQQVLGGRVSGSVTTESEMRSGELLKVARHSQSKETTPQVLKQAPRHRTIGTDDNPLSQESKETEHVHSKSPFGPLPLLVTPSIMIGGSVTLQQSKIVFNEDHATSLPKPFSTTAKWYPKNEKS